MRNKEKVICLFVFSFINLNVTFAQINTQIDSINSTLKDVLYWDQKVRIDYDDSLNEIDKEKSLKLWSQKDSINQSIVLPIINSIIANKLEGLSQESWRACFLVLQHSSPNTQLKYVDFITEYFRKGYIYHYEYLIFIDRINVQLKKAQPFGSQSGRLPNGKSIAFPVCTKADRDSAFINIGIDPRHARTENGVFSLSLEIEVKEKDIPSAFTSKANDSILAKKPTKQSEPLELDTNDFGFILIVKQDNPNFDGVLSNIKILVNGHVKGITDEDGFSSFKIHREEVPHSLHLIYPNGEEKEHVLKSINKEQDYTIEGI